MIGMGRGACPVDINFEPETFKPGDLVSYRVPEEFGDTPFVGKIVTVEPDVIVLTHYGDDFAGAHKMIATRSARPVVTVDQLD